MPGTIIKPVAEGKGSCSIKWNYKTNPLASTCKGSTDENGLSAEGNSKYVLFAELDCGDGAKHVNACEPTDGLATKEAPYLDGTCEWSRKDNNNETTTARGAIPKGITLNDVDNVCTNSNKTIVYRYDNLSKEWPKEGGPLPEAKTYSDVQATIACSGTGYTYDVTPAEPCPPLKANAGADHQMVCAGGVDEKTCKGSPVQVGNDECIDVEIAWTEQYDSPTIKMICAGNFQSPNGGEVKSSVTIKVGDKPGITKEGSNYTETSAEIAKLSVGTTEVSGICVSFESNTPGTTSVTCKLGR